MIFPGTDSQSCIHKAVVHKAVVGSQPVGVGVDARICIHVHAG